MTDHRPSLGSQETASFIANSLGERLVDRKAQGQVITALTRLRTAGEIQEQTDRDWSAQIILRAGKPPFLLKRITYDRTFPKSLYQPDPDHRERRWTDRCQWCEKLRRRATPRAGRIV